MINLIWKGLGRRKCNHHYRRYIVDARRTLFWVCVKCDKFKSDIKKGDSFEYRAGDSHKIL